MRQPRGAEDRAARTGERGIALIMVLGVLAVAGVMVAHVAVVSQVTAREAWVTSLRGELKYAAESAADRAYWLYLADRAAFPNRGLGRLDPARDTWDAESWMLDGSPHTIPWQEHSVEVRLYDADAGLDVAGTAPETLRTLLRADAEEDSDEAAAVDVFVDVLTDYTDPNDFEQLHGKEQPAYAAEGLPDLPRNGPLQFRDEIYWLDQSATVLSAPQVAFAEHATAQPFVRLVPPPGLSFTADSSARRRTSAVAKPSFFAAAPALLVQLARLTDIELEQVLAARQAWAGDGTPLGDSVDPDLLARLGAAFGLQESGVVTIVAVARTANADVRRGLCLTRDARPGQGAYADRERRFFSCWDRVGF